MDEIWITRDGQEIKIKDMSNAHLYNTIKYLKRRAEEGVVDGFINYLDPTDVYCDVLFGEEFLEETKYNELVKEAIRRNGFIIS